MIRRHRAGPAPRDRGDAAGCRRRRPRRAPTRPASRPAPRPPRRRRCRRPASAGDSDPARSRAASAAAAAHGHRVARQRMSLPCGADRSRAPCTSRAGSACGGRPTPDTSCPRPRRRRRRRPPTADTAVDVTVPAPRIPLCERCVGVSAPGEPAAAELTRPCSSCAATASRSRRRRRPGWRTDPSRRSRRRRRRRRRVRPAPSATCGEGRVRPAPSDCCALACAASRLRALITPKLTGGSATSRARGHGRATSAGESVRVARSRSISDRTGKGSRSSFAASAR